MPVMKKLAGAYLVGIAVAVAVYFAINAFLIDMIDVLTVWLALDALLLVGLALALIVNYAHKRTEGRRDADQTVTRRYLEANLSFYSTAGITILFLHNWFSLLAFGTVSQGDNHTAWVIWAVVDTAAPLIAGVTGCRLWREASPS